MNKLLLFLLPVLISISAFAQPKMKPYTAKHPNGKTSVTGYHIGEAAAGEWRYFDEQGKLLRSEMYSDNGALSGFQKTYAAGKYVATEAHYTAGLRDSSWFEFNANGDTLVHGHYGDDKRQGEWSYYHAQEPVVRNIPHVGLLGGTRYTIEVTKRPPLLDKKEHYRDGLLDGRVEHYSVYGTVETYESYKAGKKDGEWYGLDDSKKQFCYRTYAGDSLVARITLGAKPIEEQLRGGLRNGLYREYYSYSPTYSRIKTEGHFTDGIRDGKFSEYNTDGKKWIEYNYRNGVLNGERIEYDHAGFMTVKSYYKNGAYDSLYTTFFAGSNEPEKQWYCRAGKFAGPYKRWYQGLRLFDMSDKTPRPGIDRSGKGLAEEGTYADDLREGKFTGYYTDGTLKYTAYYKNGVLDGTVKAWHPNGKKYFEQNFSRGERDGNLALWNESGKSVRPVAQEVQVTATNAYSMDEQPDAIEGLFREMANTLAASDHSQEHDPLFATVQEDAQFPGGMDAFMNYLRKNIHFPAMEREAGIQGTVFVAFTVEADGSITNVRTVKGVAGGPSLSKEAERVIKQMPKWSPAKKNGRAVAFESVIPIRFMLQ